MSKEIIVDIAKQQTRVATIENGELAEIYIESTGHERIVGNIYKGRIQNVLPGMQAAFVDIGLEKNAFLYAGDILVDKSDLEFENQPKKPVIRDNIKDIIKQGQEIMVQILKEPVGTKGARVTTHITLPGRTLVLMPTVDYVGVSRRIEDEAERERLKGIVERLKPQGVGIIVRTAAAGKTEDEFDSDISFLMSLWERVKNKDKMVSAPRLIHTEEALVFRTIRDLFTADVEELIINDVDYFEKIKIVAGIISPEFEDRVHLHQGERQLFDKYDLERKIDKLLDRKVWLKSGGYIIIEHTEALTVIDVNTGKYVGSNDLQETLFKANCEAAREIARQLRLRDISGIIVIDFIDMEHQVHKDELLLMLREELKKDRTKSNVLGMSALGLVEMTRKKMRKSLATTMQTSCKYCRGEGVLMSEETIAHKVRRMLEREMENTDINIWLAEVHPSVAAFIETSSQSEPFLPQLPGRDVYVRALPYLHMEEYRVSPVLDHRALENIVVDAKIFR